MDCWRYRGVKVVRRCLGGVQEPHQDLTMMPEHSRILHCDKTCFRMGWNLWTHLLEEFMQSSRRQSEGAPLSSADWTGEGERLLSLQFNKTKLNLRLTGFLQLWCVFPQQSKQLRPEVIYKEEAAAANEAEAQSGCSRWELRRGKWSSCWALRCSRGLVLTCCRYTGPPSPPAGAENWTQTC